MIGAKPRYGRGFARDETPMHPSVRRGFVVSEGGTRHGRGEGASPPPGVGPEA